jgi:hypothetical protein
MEVILALFVVMVGLIGVLAALPTGMSSAEMVIFQDAAIHLAESKFAEFRRDRVNPLVDLKDVSTVSNYMTVKQDTLKANGFRDFAYKTPGDPFEFFDNIERYEWQVRQDLLTPVGAVAVADAANVATGAQAALMPEPKHNPSGGGVDTLARVVVCIQLKGTQKQFTFTQYMINPGKAATSDGLWEDDFK